MPGPMEGIRVVEHGVWVAGPAAGGILADWGADVIKIEPPTGDPARGFNRLLGGDMPTSPPFELDNRSKPLEEWVAIFDTEPDLFWAPLNTIEDLIADPQFHAAGGLVDVPDGSSTTTMVVTPVDFHGTPAAPRSMALALGQHTREVLGELGA